MGVMMAQTVEVEIACPRCEDISDDVIEGTSWVGTERIDEMRLDLYRAIYAGDMDEAENIANLMAMVDIDSDIIMRARKEKRT